MSQPTPAFAQEAYAVLRTRYQDQPFQSEYLSWFVSKPMVKKTLRTLEQSGWIKRTAQGRYECVSPDSVFKAMVEFRVPGLLGKAGKPYAYADASAAEVWTDHAYVQRSWEHSPYYVAVLRNDVDAWVSYLRERKVRVFVGEAKPALGEFVVLKPQERLPSERHEGVPVEPLSSVVRYCERHVEAFEYPLAYLTAKYGVKTRVKLDGRVVAEARRAT